MLDADIAFWKRIAIEVSRGTKLPVAILDMKKDSLFWIREVLNKAPSGAGRTLGGDTGVSRQQRRQQQQYQCGPFFPPGKGKGKGKKGKGKGKGKMNAAGGMPPLPPIPGHIIRAMAMTAPSTPKYPQGQAICRNLHVSHCAGWCTWNRSLCPRKLPSGEFRFKQHRLRQCLLETPS